MQSLVRLENYSRFGDFAQDRVWPELSEDDLARTRPDAHCQLVGNNDTAAARCSLWWTTTPRYGDERVGLIGHYAASDAQTARQLLDNALQELRMRGCTIAIGPMDGNTWEKYRFVTEVGAEPTFLLEPQNPSDWPQHFTAQGFYPLAGYHSSVCEQLGDNDGIVARLEQRLQRRGAIRIRPFDMANADADLRAIHDVSIDWFKGNFLQTPIPLEAFLHQSWKILPYVDPRHFLLAEDDGRLVAYVFCVPDLMQKKRGAAVDTLVLKTLAASPHPRHAGLGSLLLARVHNTAAENGYRRVIHALMHDDNSSTRTSERIKSRRFRGYTLYARRLT